MVQKDAWVYNASGRLSVIWNVGSILKLRSKGLSSLLKFIYNDLSILSTCNTVVWLNSVVFLPEIWIALMAKYVGAYVLLLKLKLCRI